MPAKKRKGGSSVGVGSMTSRQLKRKNQLIQI